MRKVRVKPWEENYQVLFGEEANLLREVLGEEAMGIFHIGSTSVPGLKSKPIIDILIAVRDISKVDSFNRAMEEVGYTALGENGIPGRRYFQKSVGDDHSHHVHVFESGNSEIERHIAFRDYLRAHPQVAEKYGTIKARLAEKHPYDIESYQSGKSAMILEIQEEAIKWYREVGRAEALQ
ncbi:MAG: GrpB family protein [Thermoplasmataceae archaeon]